MPQFRSLMMSLFAAVSLALGAGGPAFAEIVQIPGPAFVRQCPCAGSPDPAVESAGTITPSFGASSYFAALPFAGTGKVCSMTMVYRDVNEAESLRVSLLRKRIRAGAPIDAEPALMASVESASGTPDTVRKAKATMVGSPSVETESGFYYLRADFQNINMDLVGVQVDIRKSCPA